MGIYWGAVDHNKKQYFEPPKGFNNKTPGLYHQGNPFPQMMVYMNSLGYDFELDNDGHYDCYYDKDYENITEKVYEDWKKIFQEK